ncbi:Na+/H+ antiporter subunit E [Rheinheimera sp. MMS21-TC3]|uniref:Na+/H+ antiporter subunit E n=1 Tax=Rheinheimera sp. MMS21-TC3 TaxID=3072790 RepID=UPI0028C46A1C|nr:Na+/H+ antiporter subunit E [Rheinheimera sp. MMS21-TC3]WNO59674.1 Na+/H+ antiporter subunit E [Rheinheimera sp. MMS21-TC3]
MNKLLPQPFLSAVLLVVWLLLNQSVELSHWILGGLVAWFIPLWVQPLLLHRLRIHKPWVLIRLLGWSLVEIVRSALAVSSIILFKRSKNVHSEFIRIPLDMRDPHGLAMLSCLINCTPGTVWVDIVDNHELLLHVFDLQDEAWWVNTIKSRYEQPLMEVFEGVTTCS